MRDLDALILTAPPPLDPAWLAYEATTNLRDPKPEATIESTIARQPVYAAQCRALYAAMMAPGARDYDLRQGSRLTLDTLTIPSRHDGFEIPLLRYCSYAAAGDEPPKGAANKKEEAPPRLVVVYYHGGGLVAGEADSEDLSCRRIVAQSGIPDLVLYSVGYRLMPQVPASTCVSDAVDAFEAVRRRHPGARLILVGSSSGGELAAFVSQTVPRGSIHGLLLRCPVTVDAFSGPGCVPPRFQRMHTSASEAFYTTLLGRFQPAVPRSGLARMPLEIPPEELRGLAKCWIQICTNDVLYSDGLCYAKALRDAGVEVKVDVVEGWPHTFWLKAPHLSRALEADEEMLRGLQWAASD